MTDTQTDRRTDRQTPHDGIGRACLCIASRGKNEFDAIRNNAEKLTVASWWQFTELLQSQNDFLHGVLAAIRLYVSETQTGN